MYVRDALRLLARRWIVVLVGVAATTAACLAVYKYVDTEYQASSQMLLILPSEASGDLTPTNPYLNLQDGLTTTASLLAGTVSTKDVERDLAESGKDSDYAVSVVPGVGPLLLITANDTDPAVAVETRDALMKRIGVDLARLQTETAVPERQVITATPSSVSEQAEVLPGRRLRALAGAAGAGLMLTLLLAVAVDRLGVARRNRASSRRTEAVTDAVAASKAATAAKLQAADAAASAAAASAAAAETAAATAAETAALAAIASFGALDSEPDEPAVADPTADEPDAPAEVAAPVAEEPEEPGEPVAEVPEEPVAEVPEEPEEAVAEEPEEPLAEAPEEPVAEEPVAEEPVAEEPVAEKPESEKPAWEKTRKPKPARTIRSRPRAPRKRPAQARTKPTREDDAGTEESLAG